MYKRENLICQPIIELRELGKLLGVKSPTTFDKQTLIDKIIEIGEKTAITGYAYSELKNIIISTSDNKCFETVGFCYNNGQCFEVYDLDNKNTNIIMPTYVAEAFSVEHNDILGLRCCKVNNNKFVKSVLNKDILKFNEIETLEDRPIRCVKLVQKRVDGIVEVSKNNTIIFAPNLFIEETKILQNYGKLITASYEDSAKNIQEMLDFVKSYAKHEYIGKKDIYIIFYIDGIMDACERSERNGLEKIIGLFELARCSKDSKISCIGITVDEELASKLTKILFL